MAPVKPFSWVGLLLISGCVAERMVMDPTVLIESPGGTELGVSTDYGVVFAGSRIRSGPVDVTAWFADGPSVEPSVVEPIGGGLYTAEVEIRLPWVYLGFESPRPGQRVVLIGREGNNTWEDDARVASDPRVVSGLLLAVPSRLRDAPTQVGTGVYVEDDRGRRRLVGLVSGRLRLVGPEGEADYLTAHGPESLWRLVVSRREDPLKRRWVYREDIL